MENDKIFPVEEMLAYDEFTDRVEILRELDTWVKNIPIMKGLTAFFRRLAKITGYPFLRTNNGLILY